MFVEIIILLRGDKSPILCLTSVEKSNMSVGGSAENLFTWFDWDVFLSEFLMRGNYHSILIAIVDNHVEGKDAYLSTMLIVLSTLRELISTNRFNVPI